MMKRYGDLIKTILLYTILVFHEGKIDAEIKEIFASINQEHMMKAHPVESVKYLAEVNSKLGLSIKERRS